MLITKKILLSILMLMLSVSCWSVSESEKQVRAMFVYNFANFVEWPKKAFSKSTSPLQICLLGNVPFKNYLTPMSGTLIGERELRVITTNREEQFVGQCHILFVGDDQKINMKRLYSSKKYSYILSVSEQDGFLESGGIVNILDQSNNISFDIDMDNARRRGLFISSDLLSLARNIKRLSNK
jgi:hypothetical protein